MAHASENQAERRLSRRQLLVEVGAPVVGGLLAVSLAPAAAAGLGSKRMGDGPSREFDSDAYRLLARDPVAAGIKPMIETAAGKSSARGACVARCGCMPA